MYDILYTEQALNQLKKLEKEIQQRVISVLERCRIRPYNHVKKIVGSKYFRLRIGDYRVILDIMNNKLLILVVEAGHRRNTYKK
ncbi:MAG: type II toxin-antitoxin system RelE/ParE family toxin [Candidatus Thermoplasmatota archaeon]|nr:type II toxin-antitoxin system RelE/ParE family toxin [Candidatus Thermoplasmatota archaeon]